MVIETSLQSYLDITSESLDLFDSTLSNSMDEKGDNWIVDSEEERPLYTPLSMSSHEASTTLDALNEILFGNNNSHHNTSYAPGKTKTAILYYKL